jgi:hypothetical protein
MAKSTARGTRRRSAAARRRSAGEGSVYPYRGGHRGAVTWTDPDGTRHRRTVSGRTAEQTRASSTTSAVTSGWESLPQPAQ